MVRLKGGGREFDPEYKHFRAYVDGQWGNMDWTGDLSRSEISQQDRGTYISGLQKGDPNIVEKKKKALDVLMMRKGVYNANRVNRREKQQQTLLDVAWKELYTGSYKAEGREYPRWSSLSQAEKDKYAYRDEQGRKRYNRPDFFFTEIQGKIRVKEFAPKNAERINSDPNIPYGIRLPKPYKKKGRDAPVVVTKWQIYDKKTGRIVRGAGA